MTAETAASGTTEEIPPAVQKGGGESQASRLGIAAPIWKGISKRERTFLQLSVWGQLSLPLTQVPFSGCASFPGSESRARLLGGCARLMDSLKSWGPELLISRLMCIILKKNVRKVYLSY